MNRSRIFEVTMMLAIMLLVLVGGQRVLILLTNHRPFGWLIAGGLCWLAAWSARRARDPENPDARVNVTKAGVYLCAALLALWAVLLHEPHWVYGSCIVATEVALVFDLITIVAPRRAGGT